MEIGYKDCVMGEEIENDRDEISTDYWM